MELFSSSYVGKMLDAFKKVDDKGVHMSTKIHFLHYHINYFENQLTTESDEHGELFHQTCLPIEERNKGKNVHALMLDQCWTLYDAIELPRSRSWLPKVVDIDPLGSISVSKGSI